MSYLVGYQQQPKQLLLLVVLLLNVAGVHPIRYKPSQQKLDLGVGKVMALHSNENSTDSVPLSLLVLQQHQATGLPEDVPASAADVSTTTKRETQSFLQHSGWVLPRESKQTRGMFNWYTNPYTYVIVGVQAVLLNAAFLYNMPPVGLKYAQTLFLRPATPSRDSRLTDRILCLVKQHRLSNTSCPSLCIVNPICVALHFAFHESEKLPPSTWM
ncbi:uncharacterized protein EMH_0053630 [Eimeria mitis]|uniref:Uncharacterized protein n=1 Tax=Eimeria mitis TaxID=44415 RepID=U6KID5_9EIME|nr:uncharacterized protein EMH_0053630 [Eimeria mitis]CDJ36007.1 hypothetical protein, conserved [Eimeria mitis]